jgi:cell shape-determining protein MreD
MKETLLRSANLLLFVTAAMVLASLQTSLWFQVFGYFPGPALWIPCLVYIALFRSTLEAVLFSYVMGVALAAMTTMPEGLLMIVCLALVLSTQTLKSRIYWTSSSYLMMVSGLAALCFHFYHWIASYIIGDHPLSSPNVMDWLIEALLTPLTAPPLFPIFQWFDRVTNREPPTEASAPMS